MRETQLLSALYPAHPGFLPILQNITEKNNIPEISPQDDSIKELLLSEGIDLDTIRQYIENQLKDNPDLLPTGSYKFF
jgi:hypothetical protein